MLQLQHGKSLCCSLPGEAVFSVNLPVVYLYHKEILRLITWLTSSLLSLSDAGKMQVIGSVVQKNQNVIHVTKMFVSPVYSVDIYSGPDTLLRDL